MKSVKFLSLADGKTYSFEGKSVSLPALDRGMERGNRVSAKSTGQSKASHPVVHDDCGWPLSVEFERWESEWPDKPFGWEDSEARLRLLDLFTLALTSNDQQRNGK